MKPLKKRLQSGESLTGCWLNLGSRVSAEIVALAGFDWVLIDLEHGAGGEQDTLGQLQAVEHTDAAPVVRVESCNPQRIGRVLDMGAIGIMCPRINRPEEADTLVRSLRYPPEGNRGVARMVRATGFGSRFSSYHQASAESILGIAQIETREGLKNLEAIASVDGVDVLFIGPADLSMELGIYGEFSHPRFQEAVTTIVEAAERNGKATGILLTNPEDASHYHNLGVRMIACGADGAFVAAGAGATAKRLAELIEKPARNNG